MESKENLIRIVLLSLLLYAACCLAAAGRDLRRAEDAERLRANDLEAVERENLRLRRRLEEGWSAEELEAMARERLGLVLPGDRVFLFPPESP